MELQYHLLLSPSDEDGANAEESEQALEDGRAAAIDVEGAAEAEAAMAGGIVEPLEAAEDAADDVVDEGVEEEIDRKWTCTLVGPAPTVNPDDKCMRDV